MIYPIYVYGSSVLRKVAENIGNDYPNLKQLIDDMYETMYDSSGVGIAAPQIGISSRIFVVDATPFAEDEPKMENFKKVFINAEIYDRSGEDELFDEGCLSVPGIREDVSRKSTISIRYQDENFNTFDETYDGIAARIIQHEYDHLDGQMFIDHLSTLRKRLIKSKLSRIAKGDYKASYRSKIVK